MLPFEFTEASSFARLHFIIASYLMALFTEMSGSPTKPNSKVTTKFAFEIDVVNAVLIAFCLTINRLQSTA